ncbi:hypothetical protein ACFQ60_45940 [Streptomyces zhihengii]
MTLLTPDGATAAVLSGTAERTWALGFAPAAASASGLGGTSGRTLLLVMRERAGRYHLGVWTPGGGLELLPWCSFDTETTARWYPGPGVRGSCCGRTGTAAAGCSPPTWTAAS